MRKNDVDENLSALAFDFFYWFSRFEFALKENGYLKSRKVGVKAEAGWNAFVEEWHTQYTASTEASALLAEPPEQQIVSPNNGLCWKAVELDKCGSELAKVVLLLKTVRNNLFHGGKHGGAGWDDPSRTMFLLSSGMAVLNQLVQLGLLDADYTQYY